MNKKMVLTIENFGAINNARIELKKINIIAGVNGSGKSTSSKLLSCFLTATSKEGHYLANNSIYERFVHFILYWHNKLSLNQSDNTNIDELLTLIGDNENLIDKNFNFNLKKRFELLNEMISSIEFQEKQQFTEDLNEIKQLLKFNEDVHHKYFNVSNVLLNSEFNFSELKDYEKAHVKFEGEINNCNFMHEIDFNGERIGAKINEGYVECLNFEDVIYIDSPSIFEFENKIRLFNSKIPHHLTQLYELISSEKNDKDVFDNEYYHKIIKFQEMFNNLLNGAIYYNTKKRSFVFKQGAHEYSMKNTASGIKQIGIIQILLENRHLKENSFLFIDEPEINLHPEWQIKLAELLILLSKELNIYIYINSHSPQFIEALEVFSVKYGLIEDTKFYLSKKLDKDKFDFEEIKWENLVDLYNNLGDPYDILDEIRAENIINGLE